MKRAMRRIIDRLRYYDIREYKPTQLYQPSNTLDVDTGWRGHELIVRDIVDRFRLKTESCLEFGVEFGYSSVVLSNFFDRVVGVDTFEGDIHSSRKVDHYDETRADLKRFDNIELYKMDYKEWMRRDNNRYDLIHVDIIHTYDDTFKCGLWSATRSTCTLFHDTESFREVKKAVVDIARVTKKTFYNYKPHYGLGILV